MNWAFAQQLGVLIPQRGTNRTRFSKQLSNGFAFTNTDSDDVTWGCSLTVIVSVIVGSRNLSNDGHGTICVPDRISLDHAVAPDNPKNNRANAGL